MCCSSEDTAFVLNYSKSVTFLLVGLVVPRRRIAQLEESRNSKTLIHNVSLKENKQQKNTLNADLQTIEV